MHVSERTGFGQGFDEFVELRIEDESERLDGADERTVRGLYVRAEGVNAAVLEWLREEEHAPERPVFLYVHYLDPHSPYLSGEEPGLEGTRDERKHGAYRQEVRYLDEHLGVLFEALRRELEGPIAIVFTSDHGEEFYEHGEWGHGHSLYGEQIRVPAFVHRTDAARPATLSPPLEMRDLFDLVMRLARPDPIDPAAWAEARARKIRYASQFLRRATKGWPDRQETALRLIDDGETTLIWSAYGPSWQMYDRSGDPGETRNLVGSDPARAAALRTILDEQVRFWASTRRVEPNEEDREFLRALGYFGGTE